MFEGSVSGGWQGRVDLTLDLDSDYKGEVFVANHLDPSFTPGFVITGIKFIAKQNPETSDMGMLPPCCSHNDRVCAIEEKKKPNRDFPP